MEAINPRSPPMTRSPHVEDKKGITVHDMQFPFEPVPVPPPEPPFGPEGEAGSTCIVIDFVSCWGGVFLSIAENGIVYVPVWLFLGVQEKTPVTELNVAPGGSHIPVRSMTGPGLGSLALTTHRTVLVTVS